MFVIAQKHNNYMRKKTYIEYNKRFQTHTQLVYI